MSWRENLPEARARLARLEAREEQLMTGSVVTKMASGGESMEFATSQNPLGDLRAAIRETQIVIARLSGRSMGGAIIPTLGG